MKENQTKIHPTAQVDSKTKLGQNVEIGPFCVIGPDVEIGNDCVLYSHVVIDGHTQIGSNNKFFQFCSIGAPPQDNSYKGEKTWVKIGEGNVFREYVSVHRGTMKQDGQTLIGNNSLFMATSHIGHDVVVGNKVVIVNGVNLAGHVKVGDNCIIGGGTNIAQFITLGRSSYIGGASAVDRDVPHFCTAYGNRIRLKGVNIVGMRRLGHSKQVISELVDFYKSLETSSLSARAFVEKKDLMKEYENNEIILEIAQFILQSQIGIAPFFN